MLNEETDLRNEIYSHGNNLHIRVFTWIAQLSYTGFDISIKYHGPPKPRFLEVYMVNNLVFRWPKPVFFMVLGAHGIHKTSY